MSMSEVFGDEALLARGDRVLVLNERIPPRLLAHMLRGRLVRKLPETELRLIEVQGRRAPARLRPMGGGR